MRKVIKICSKCGTVSEEGRDACAKCGSSDFQLKYLRQCPFCGVEVVDSTIVCPNCHRILPPTEGGFEVKPFEEKDEFSAIERNGKSAVSDIIAPQEERGEVAKASCEEQPAKQSAEKVTACPEKVAKNNKHKEEGKEMDKKKVVVSKNRTSKKMSLKLLGILIMGLGLIGFIMLPMLTMNKTNYYAMSFISKIMPENVAKIYESNLFYRISVLKDDSIARLGHVYAELACVDYMPYAFALTFVCGVVAALLQLCSLRRLNTAGVVSLILSVLCVTIAVSAMVIFYWVFGLSSIGLSLVVLTIAYFISLILMAVAR